MAIALRSVGVSPGANSTSCVIVKPAGLTVGDLMIAQVVSSWLGTPGAISAPGSWTEIRQDVGLFVRSALFWKIATSGDVSASDFTFTTVFLDANDSNIGAITAWTGHNTSTPINANNGQFNDASTTVTSPAITPSVANTVILMFVGIADSRNTSAYAIATDNPASWTEAYDIKTTEGSDASVAMGYADRPETSSTGLGTATIDGSRRNTGQLVAIAPEEAATPQAVGDGTISPASTLGRFIKVIRGAGTITPTGALTAILRFVKTVGEGTVTPTGVLTSDLRLSQAVGDGTVTPAGALEWLIKKAVGDGSVTPAGALTRVVSPLFGGMIVRVAFDTDPMADTPIWTEVSADVQSLYTKRGRQHELNRIETGIAIIQLLNTGGNYWPLNTGGAYYPKVLPGKKINIRAIFDGTFYDLYTGFIESWEPGWTKGQIAGVTVRCTDIGKRFTRFDLNNAGEAQELSGTRIGNVLDEIGWPAADRDLDAGQTTLKATGTQVAVNAMTHLFLVQDTEVGIIFLAPDGDLQFQDRHARLKSPYTVSQATFGDDPGELGYRMLKPSYDDQYIFNDIRRTRDDGTEQTASDVTSQDDYGKSTSNKTGLLMLQDAEAQDQCSYMLSQYKDPTFRMKAMELYPEIDPSNLFPKVLGYDISTRITVRNNEASLDKDYYIEGITHNFSPGSDIPWTTRWNLSDASNVVYWALGVAGFSELGETTRLSY